ncbi:hypothetical protein JXM67_02855 [candidate division WOR-3 bacterium]|nr:hypothetical protein [candidate division WOR-3 bacterium]
MAIACIKSNRRRWIIWGAALLSIILLTPSANALLWGPEIKVTRNTLGHYFSPNNAWNVAAFGDSVYIVCHDDRDGPDRLYYSFSSDRGTFWLPDDMLVGDGLNPSIDASSNNVHIVAMYDDGTGIYDVVYYRSLDNGETWSSMVNLSNLAASQINSKNPSIVVAGNNLHVVWEEEGDIKYALSTNNGDSWDTTMIVSGASASIYPSVALSGGDVHVVWCDDSLAAQEIFCINYDGSWGSKIRVSIDNSNNSTYPSVAASGDNVHVVWEDSRDGAAKVYYNRSLDKGVTWQPSDLRLIDISSAAAAFHPSIAASGSDVHVVWHDERNTDAEIYYDYSGNNGSTWGADQRLTNASADSYDPSVTTYGNELHLVWIDEREDMDIYYRLAGEAQPDNHIRNNLDTDFVGDDTINLTGENQTKIQSVRPGDTAIYHIKIQNDGGIPDVFSVVGDSSMYGWTLRYFDDTTAGADITNDVISTGWQTVPLSPDSFDLIRLEVFAAIEPDSETYGVLVVSASEGDTTKKDAVMAATSIMGGFQPDGMIKGRDDPEYVGNGIYNLDGTNQTKHQIVNPGDTAVYHLLFQNDSEYPDRFSITGSSGGAGWQVHYYDALEGGSDITIQIVALGWTTMWLDPDSIRAMRVELVAPSTPAPACEALIKAVSTDTSKKDAVKASASNTAVSEHLPLVCTEYSLSSVPANRGALIQYGLPEAGVVQLFFYDTKGSIVRTQDARRREPGYYQWMWDGYDNQGLTLPKGVYFCVLRTETRCLKNKVLIVK